jgi:hypothetical protein
MFKIISWFAWAFLMFTFAVMDWFNGDIFLAILAGLCGVMDLWIAIYEIIERKRLKKLESEWEAYRNEREDT